MAWRPSRTADAPQPLLGRYRTVLVGRSLLPHEVLIHGDLSAPKIGGVRAELLGPVEKEGTRLLMTQASEAARRIGAGPDAFCLLPYPGGRILGLVPTVLPNAWVEHRRVCRDLGLVPTLQVGVVGDTGR